MDRYDDLMYFYLKRSWVLFLYYAGKYLSMLPVDPKLGKMLIMGAVFRCLDPVLTVVSGLSVRDPFLLPQDKKDVSKTLVMKCFSFVIDVVEIPLSC